MDLEAYFLYKFLFFFAKKCISSQNFAYFCTEKCISLGKRYTNKHI